MGVEVGVEEGDKGCGLVGGEGRVGAPGLRGCRHGDRRQCPALDNRLPISSSRAHTGRVPASSQWVAFLIASILFIQVPGPSLLFTIGRALTVGRREALLSVVGNAVGVTAQALFVAVGLGAVVAASITAYTVIKVAGAAYVIWLGIQAIRHRHEAREALEAQVSAKRGHALRVGFLVGVTNPKTILFFVAFLPQFTNARAGHVAVQMVVLGAVFGLMAICSDSMWALLAARAREWFARKPDRLEKLGVTGGVMMVGLGATMLARE